jgi:hypothetical protein
MSITLHYHGNIILTAWEEDEGKIYIIDGNNYRIKRKDTIYDNIMSFNKDFVCLQNSVYYIKRFGNEIGLIKVDLSADEITENYPLFFPLRYSYLRAEEENILVHGEYLYLFKTTTKEFLQLSNNSNTGLCSVINARYAVFADGDAVYCYNLKKKTKKEIYNLNGMGLFKLFMYRNRVVLVMASDINESLADNLLFTLVTLDFDS